jgi:hypothetical protein
VGLDSLSSQHENFKLLSVPRFKPNALMRATHVVVLGGRGASIGLFLCQPPTEIHVRVPDRVSLTRRLIHGAPVGRRVCVVCVTG